MIAKETYQDLKSLLYDTTGVAWDSESQVEYLNAIIILVEEYEKEHNLKPGDDVL